MKSVDNKGQASIEWLVIVGAILILLAMIIYFYQTQVKIGKAKDYTATTGLKDKIYSI